MDYVVSQNESEDSCSNKLPGELLKQNKYTGKREI